MIGVRELPIDVLTAGHQRIKSIFANGLPVYLSFSGGKDSLVLAHLTLAMAKAGEIDLRQLRVEFIDEEAIFPCVERVVTEWRERFLLLGVPFAWYCLEVKHYSCLNRLENDESFICFDRTKADVWIRQPPPFAIRSHPLLRPRKDTYQQFLQRLADGPHMVGLRTAESVQRFYAVAWQKDTATKYHARTYPIYDWTDDDVWLYLKQHRYEIAIPDAYLHLFQLGIARPRLRISQFFSVDTAYALARMAEHYPQLMEKILAREPAAYLASLYWDSEMFRRRSPRRRAAEAQVAPLGPDPRERVLTMLNDIPRYFPTAATQEVARHYRRLVIGWALTMKQQPDYYRLIHDALVAGDPKRRQLRAISVRLASGNAGEHAHPVRA